MKDSIDIFAALISPEQEKFVYAALASLLTAILAGIGYLIKRRMEQKPKLDALEVNERALRILKELATQNLSIEEFHIRKEQILNPPKSPGKQEQRVLVEVTQLQLNQLVSGDADTSWLEVFRWQFRVDVHLHERINQEEAAMFAANQALLNALYERKEFDEAMDLIEEQNEWRKCWPDLKAVTAKYEDHGVGIMFYNSEFAVVMWERAAELQSRLREVEHREALPPSSDAPQLSS